MKKSWPLVSVVMPVYNTERYVGEAIESVLAQADVSVELIVIDDGSTDGTREVLRSYGDRIKLVESDANSGIGAARNRGIAIARGEFLAFMDADDIWRSEKLSKQLAQFEADPDLDISFTMMQCFLSPELSDEIKARRHCPPDPAPGQLPPTVLVKKTSFDRVGPFDPKWRVGEFVDWLARARHLGLKQTMLGEVMLDRRIHDGNTGVVARDARADYVRIVREALERKRNNP